MSLERSKSTQQLPSYWIFAGQEDLHVIVAKHYGIEPDCLKMKTRKRIVVEPRQVAMAIMVHQHRHTLEQIGEIMGGFDHATVTHAVKIVRHLYESYPAKRKLLDDINQQTLCDPAFPMG